MIDPKIIRTEPEKIITMLKNRNVEVDITELLGIDKKRRELITELESYKMKRNKISQEISTKKRQDADISKTLTEMKSISTKIEELQDIVKKLLLHHLLFLLVLSIQDVSFCNIHKNNQKTLLWYVWRYLVQIEFYLQEEERPKFLNDRVLYHQILNY